jgi:hypothetical protein
MPAKEITYNSVADRFVAERDAKELIRILIAIMEDREPGAFEEGVNKLFPQANGEPYTASYRKPA